MAGRISDGTASYMAPVACLTDWIIEKIPGIRDINFSIDQLQEKAGVLAEPIIIGGIMGTAIGLLAGDRPDEAFMLGIQMSAVMVLMPQIVKCIMEGLLPLSERAKKILPRNQVLPFGDLATISFFIAIAVAVHKGNFFRTLFSGSAIMYMTIWISNQTIPWMTKLAEVTGSLQGGGRVAALDQGGSPITYVFTQLFVKENLSGAAVIAENSDVFDPKKYNAAGREEVKKYVMQKIMVVGSNGKAK